MKKFRDLVRELMDAGFQTTTCVGSHQKFHHAEANETVVLKINHLSADAGFAAEKMVRKKIQATINIARQRKVG